jgi:hypothetical protein
LNGVSRKAHKTVDMSEVAGPQDMQEIVRRTVLDNLSSMISAEVFKQNLKTINKTGTEYAG